MLNFSWFSRFASRLRRDSRSPKRRIHSAQSRRVTVSPEFLEDRALLAATMSVGLNILNNLLITDDGGTNNNLTISNDGAGNLVITDSVESFTSNGGLVGATLSNNDQTLTVPLASIPGSQVIFDAGTGNDTLTVLFTNSLGRSLLFNGGTGGNDSLVLGAGSTTTVTHTLTNANDGSVALVGAIAETIDYTGLEPVTDNLSAVDRVFTFNGGAETITVSDGTAADGKTQIDSTLSESVYFANPSGSLTINGGGGNDTITVTSVDAGYNASLTINGDTGDDTVNLNGDITFAAGKNLNVDLQNDDATPGIDTINIGTDANLILSGAGAATLTASRNIALASGSSVVTVNGNLDVKANQQATAATGNFHGVYLANGLIQATGTGAVTVQGKGGNDSSNSQGGVYVELGGDIIGGTSGLLTVQGTGGASSYGLSFGVIVLNSGSTITSGGAAIVVTGTAGGLGSSSDNYGVNVAAGGQIFGTGSTSVTVTGTSGSTSGGVNEGVIVHQANSRIGTVDGNLIITGTAVGGGVQGMGVEVYSSGTISATGSGTITITGTGSATGSGGENQGVRIDSGSSLISSNTGAIQITATAGAGSTAFSIDTNTPSLTTTNAPITVVADSIGIASSATITAGSSNTVTLRQRTDGTNINLGGADVLSGSPLTLGLSDAELDRITAGKIVVGDSLAGAVTFSSAISMTNSNTLEVITGSTINDGGSATVYTDGNLVLNAGVGAGTTSTLNVLVTNLEAFGGSGGISVTNAGALNIGGIGSMTGVSTTSGGNITLTTAAGALTVSEGVNGNGITTLLGATDVTASGNISSSGNVSVTAGTGAITTTSTSATIGSGGTVTLLAATDISLQGQVSSGGARSLTATSGSITTTGSSSSISGISDSTLNAGTFVNLAAFLSSSANTTVTAGSYVSFAASVSGATSTSVTAETGSISTTTSSAQISSSGLVTLLAAIDVSLLSSVSSSSGSVSITATGGSITTTGAPSIGSGGTTTLIAGTNVSLSGALAGNSGISITAGTGSITMTSTSASIGSGGNVTLLAGTDVSLQGVVSNGGSRSITATSGSITTGPSASIGGSSTTTLVAGIDVSLSASLSASGSNSVTAGTGSITTTSSSASIGGGGDVTLLAGTNVSLLGSISNGGGRSITATSGFITTGPSASIGGSNNTTLLAGTDVTLGASLSCGGSNTITAGTGSISTISTTASIGGGGPVTLLAGTNISLQGSVSNGGDRSITATAGSITTIGSLASIGGGGNTTLLAGTYVDLASSLSGTITSVTAGSYAIFASSVSGSASNSITAGTGSISTTTISATISGGGAITLLAATDISLLAPVSSGGSRTITATAGSITTGSSASIGSGGNTILLAGTNVTLAASLSNSGFTTITAGTGSISTTSPSASIGGGGAVTLLAGTDVSLLGSISNGNSRSITATAGSITSGSSASMSGGGDTTLLAGTNVTFGATLSNGGNNTITAGTGSISTTSSAANITCSGTVTLLAATDISLLGAISNGTGRSITATAGAITIGPSASIGGGGDTTLLAGTNVSLANVVASAGTTSITAGNSITTSDNTGTDVSSQTVILNAGAGGIGSTSNFLRMFADTVTANTTGNGNINLVEYDTVTIGDNDLNAGTGTITLGGGRFLTTPTGSILSPVTVDSGAILGGSGTTGPVSVLSGGSVSPGSSPGVIHTGNVSFATGSTFAVEVNGTATAGTDFDQLSVNGTVNLNGATLSQTGSISANSGQSVVLIDNDGSDPIVGTFNGLPEGSALAINGFMFQITYVGGSNGNDVELIPALVNLSVSSATGTEAGTTVITVTAAVNVPVIGDQTVSVAVSGTGIDGADYTLSNTTITIPNGAMFGTVTFTVKNDQFVEGTETATLTISNPSVGIALGTTTTQDITITDDDTATVTLSGTANATEGGVTGSLTATLTLQTNGTGPAQLLTDITGIALLGTADYSSDSVSFLSGALNNATRTLTVTVANDQLVEGSESTSATLVNTTSAAVVIEAGSGTVNITDDDSATVTLSGTANTAEGGATGSLTATLTLQTNGTGPAQLATDITGVTLSAHPDFSSDSVSFLSGALNDATRTLTVTATNDLLIEGPETFPASLANTISNAAVAETGSGTVNITDNDNLVVQFNQSTGSDFEATGGNLPRLVVTGQIQTGYSVSINLGVGPASTADGTDYTFPTTLTVGPGTYAATPLAIPGLSIINDSKVEADETIVLNNITGTGVAVGAQSSTTYTIKNDDTNLLKISAPTITETNADQIVTFTVTSPNAVQGGFDVIIGAQSETANGTDFELLTRTVHFNGTAQETQSVSVRIIGDTIVEVDETFKVTLGSIANTSSTQRAVIVSGAAAIATIVNDDTNVLSISAPQIVETTADPKIRFGNTDQTVTFTVTSANAIQGGFDVSITATNGTAGSSDYALVTKKVHFQGLAGETQLVSVTIKADALVEGNETFVVTLGTISNTTPSQKAVITTGASATGVIIDDDSPAPSGRVSKSNASTARVSRTAKRDTRHRGNRP